MTTKHTSQIPFLLLWMDDGATCFALPCSLSLSVITEKKRSSSSFFRFLWFSMYGFDIFSVFQVRACVPAYTVF